MGSGSSAALTPSQQGELARKLGESFEAMKRQGISDEMMRVALETQAKELLDVQNSTRVSIVTTGSTAPIPGAKQRRDTGILKKGGGGIPGLKRPAPSAGGFDEGDEEEEEEEGEGGEIQQHVVPAPVIVAPHTVPTPAAGAGVGAAAAVVATAAAAEAAAGAAATKARPVPISRQQSYAASGPAAGGKVPSSLPSGKSKGGATRRRSFDPAKQQEQMPSMGTSQSSPIIGLAAAQFAATATAEAAAAEAAAAAESQLPDRADHWDSVSQLPYCTVCEMAFKSTSLLERHNKYSDLHMRTVKKKEEQAAAALKPEADASGEEALQLEQAKQVEGRDYKHLYYGSKFFWRTQDNVDFTFFHHLLADCVEVVAFSVYKNKELNRCYLNMYLIAGRCPAPVKGQEDSTRTAITTFILSRLQLESDGTTQTMVYVPAAGDDFKSPALAEKPLMVIPRPVTHRRNTSTDEITKKLEELRADQQALTDSTKHAERIGAFVVNFASNFKKSSQRMAAMSLPRRRWIMTINRVLQINGVFRTTKYLEEMEARGEKPGLKTGRRGRSNTDPREAN